jgi:hypothetical protein
VRAGLDRARRQHRNMGRFNVVVTVIGALALLSDVRLVYTGRWYLGVPFGACVLVGQAVSWRWYLRWGRALDELEAQGGP